MQKAQAHQVNGIILYYNSNHIPLSEKHYEAETALHIIISTVKRNIPGYLPPVIYIQQTISKE